MTNRFGETIEHIVGKNPEKGCLILILQILCVGILIGAALASVVWWLWL